MKLTVHDLIVVEREVELPDKCPKCGHKFEEGDEFLVWEYQDQQRHATITSINDEWDWPDLPKAGESYFYISWQCKCGYPLAKSGTVVNNG